jgi:hypothetical protein
MTTRTIRICLRSLLAISAAVVTLAVALVALGPLSNFDQASTTHSLVVKNTKAQTRDLSFADVAKINLRQPLFDMNVSSQLREAETIESRGSRPAVNLVGTILEPGHSMGIFISAAGKTELKTIGEEIDGSKIISIRPATATLIWNNEQVVVAIPTAGLKAPEQSPGRPSAPEPVALSALRAPQRPTFPPAAPGSRQAADDEQDQAMRSFLDKKPALEGDQ